jgi:hypothetical protein
MAKLDVEEAMWASPDDSTAWWGIVGARYITASCASFTRLRDSGAACAECAVAGDTLGDKKPCGLNRLEAMCRPRAPRG